MKKISIITVVKNGMPYIREALSSFNLQDYENKELVIICTKSEDGTEEFLNNNLNKNVKLFYTNEDGIYKAINVGLKKSTGEIIGILHSDDIFYSNKILSSISEKFQNEKLDLCYGDIVFCKRNDLLNIVRIWIEKSYSKNLPKYWTPPHTSVFIKKSEKTNIFYDENYKISSDTKYLLQLLKKNDLNISYMPGIITVMRAGGISFSYKNFSGILTKITEDLKIFTNMGFDFFDYFKKIIIKIKQIAFIKKKLNYDEKYFLSLLDKNKVIHLIKDASKINFNKNFILSGLNLAFVAYYFDKKIKKVDSMIHWPDGIFCKRIKKNIKKVPGRELIKTLLIPKQINSIHIIGNISEKSKNYMKNLYNLEIKHTELPYGTIDKIEKFLPSQTSDKELYILTLPTPKQEQCAQLMAQKNEHFKIICIGGAINIASGEESSVPVLLDKLGLEFFWRLKSDTWRRTKRLAETFFIYLISEIKNKFKNLYIKEI